MNFSINIGVVDSTIVVVYLLAVLAFGLWVGRGQRTSADYFLGGRSLPWGALLTAATHGTNPLMVQRYLSARNQQDAARGLAFSGLIVFAQFAVFLLIGVALMGFFRLSELPNPMSTGNGDQLFAFFIVNHMPVGLTGLTLAAVFAAAMSTLSSSLNSSATVLIKDVYLPLRKKELSQRGQLTAGRIATAGFGLLQVAIAIEVGMIGTTESVVANVLKIAGFATGPVLGLYLLAVFAHRVEQPAAILGFVGGVASLSVIAYGTDLYWPWYAAVGSLLTFFLGWIIQQFWRK